MWAALDSANPLIRLSNVLVEYGMYSVYGVVCSGGRDVTFSTPPYQSCVAHQNNLRFFVVHEFLSPVMSPRRKVSLHST